ncbi:hypothetical protein BBR47_52930 [Brevibacillus brevis NBRC 100599]|uniref:Uncharacterized protein n=1 Tax=Brevibacillus brevis (strain 47 / JCM 6285 / NBRC 100599) TaxID=358681 RepID=C0Z6S1_BREBN|nr:hypothetical protein BBR47_52930 [Brevibacillus brevis NBRC 100599]
MITKTFMHKQMMSMHKNKTLFIREVYIFIAYSSLNAN